MSEEEEKRLKRNEYHRNWYKSNLEKQRARNKEKYHRLKHNWETNLSEEKKELRRIKNREYQKILYTKNYVKKEKAVKIKKEKIDQPKKLAPPIEIPEPIIELPNLMPKKFIHPKYIRSEVIAVLKKDMKHKLWDKVIADWNAEDWKQFKILKNTI